MLGLLHVHDIESLQEIAQDDDARRLLLRMAALSQAGRIEPFLHQLMGDEEIDAETKGTLAEIAGDATLLAALDEYVRSTEIVH